MTIRRLAMRASLLSIAILWLNWSLNNNLVERGWLTRGEPIVVAGVGLMVGLGAWMFLTRPWEREERMPIAFPPAEEMAKRLRDPDPLVPVLPDQEMSERARSESRGTTAGDLTLLLASALLLVAAVAALPDVAKGLKAVW